MALDLGHKLCKCAQEYMEARQSAQREDPAVSMKRGPDSQQEGRPHSHSNLHVLLSPGLALDGQLRAGHGHELKQSIPLCCMTRMLHDTRAA
eukprot:1160261-Pelagomonas_calceolata.AAC.2